MSIRLSDKPQCFRCGRRIPKRREGQTFCTDRCEREQRYEDDESARMEREEQDEREAAPTTDIAHELRRLTVSSLLSPARFCYVRAVMLDAAAALAAESAELAVLRAAATRALDFMDAVALSPKAVAIRDALRAALQPPGVTP